jgi:hypothetical protein
VGPRIQRCRFAGRIQKATGPNYRAEVQTAGQNGYQQGQRPSFAAVDDRPARSQ